MAWAFYKSKVHSKKCWNFGFGRSPNSFTIDFWVWSWTVYDDEF